MIKLNLSVPIKIPWSRSQRGLYITAMAGSALNVPSPFPSRMDTVPSHVFTKARSTLPSPLKSAATTPTGLLPVG